MSNTQLPRWDLSDFYKNHTDPKITDDLNTINDLCDAFVKNYQTKINDDVDGKTLGTSIVEFEQLKELAYKVMSYAGLLAYADVENAEVQQFQQSVTEKITSCFNKVIFYTLALNKMNEDVLSRLKSEDETVGRYGPWLRDVRSFAPYQLDEVLEKLMIDKSITGSNMWVRLYDETLAGLRFDYDGERIGVSAVLDHMSSKCAKTREKAATSLRDGLKQSEKVFALITNTLAKDKETNDTWRKFKTPMDSRHLENNIEGDVVECLCDTVKSNYQNLSHRFYKLKAKLLNVDKLQYWDRNAPIGSLDDVKIPYNEGKDIVLKAYNAFSPTLAKHAQTFFDKNWIDVPCLPSKHSGAFSHPTVPSVHPYILLNYQDKLRDVATLAHELGHGVHQILAAEQGLFMSDTPLTLAETASVFGEMLTFQSLLEKCESDEHRMILIESKISDMINTVVRQIAFYEFEKKVHHKRREGSEIALEELEGFWLQTQRDALGDGVDVDERVGNFWCYISHFIHAPFYVYSYAFGDCLVNALYQHYMDHPDGFEEKYLNMLKAGGSLHHKDLLKPFNIDISKSDFWEGGLKLITSYIDQLETLINKRS